MDLLQSNKTKVASLLQTKTPLLVAPIFLPVEDYRRMDPEPEVQLHEEPVKKRKVRGFFCFRQQCRQCLHFEHHPGVFVHRRWRDRRFGSNESCPQMLLCLGH